MCIFLYICCVTFEFNSIFSVARNVGQNSETIFWTRSYAHRVANHFVYVLFLYSFGGAKSQRKW